MNYASLLESLKKYDFSFLYGLKKRLQTESLGPRRVAEIDGVVYISDYFSGTITTLGGNQTTASADAGIELNAFI